LRSKLAEVHAGIMTGDGDLRALVAENGVKVNGTRWAAELIARHQCAWQALRRSTGLMRMNALIFHMRRFACFGQN
jgi:hypothetical protein